MGVLYDYFAAPSDEIAAGLIEDGPGRAPASPALKEALRSGDRQAMRLAARPKVQLSDSGFLLLAMKGLDPAVQLGTLEALLTGRRYDDITKGPRQCHVLAALSDGELLVVTLTDELQAALATATADRLAAVAREWARTDELQSREDPDEVVDSLAELLSAFADLARRAGERGERLYCRICV